MGRLRDRGASGVRLELRKPARLQAGRTASGPRESAEIRRLCVISGAAGCSGPIAGQLAGTKELFTAAEAALVIS